MPNQPAESYHVKRYLINCFVHPLTAAIFTTWKQVKLLESGKYTLEEALYMQYEEISSRFELHTTSPEDEFY